MIENLVIVESPAKAKTIGRFLGKDFTVKSSFGHIRDLSKKNLGINIEKDFEPEYVVSADKKKIVKELKDLSKDAAMVWLASDEDREGEAIAWHLFEVLQLDPQKTRRIVFHEITKNAIDEAIRNPRFIDTHLVNAQQARRILDRLVGFELSPLLWKKVKPALSAGRVQSVAVKLIVEREREINSFSATPYYRVNGIFQGKGSTAGEVNIKAELNKRFASGQETRIFLDSCIQSSFSVASVEKKPARKSPAPPFTTSTLQQEASRKLGFSVSQTMSVAQRLYEAGLITYMRTDSVNLSGLAIAAAADVIKSTYGENYHHARNFQTKTKGAQEAHEAIRPTYLNNVTVPGNRAEQRLYELIWKRTIASQMSEAKLEKTTITIDISNRAEKFLANGEILIFDGFLKVYLESLDDENEEETRGLLPAVKNGEQLEGRTIEATQKFTQQPPRYTEASLVKKMEELGIGRPSTYAPTISTIQQREYVIKEDRPGTTRNYEYFILEQGKIRQETRKENVGFEKAKLFPTDIGLIVNDFLEQYFKEIMDYNFTATVEKSFDEIALGKMNWPSMIRKFYVPFHDKVNQTSESSEKTKGEKLLGTDPQSGKPVYVKIGRFGPIAQLGEATDEEKPRFASLLKGQSIETISLEEALTLFRLPRNLGEWAGAEVTIGIGKFGPYARYQGKFYSLAKTDDPYTIGLERSIEIIRSKQEEEKNRVIRLYEEEPGLQVLNGRYGPYITFNKENFKIPKGTDPAALTLEQCREIIAKGPVKAKKSTKK
ncbi:MAG: type I DNA topoisomerase [Bacteroidota bacterium]